MRSETPGCSCEGKCVRAEGKRGGGEGEKRGVLLCMLGVRMDEEGSEAKGG